MDVTSKSAVDTKGAGNRVRLHHAPYGWIIDVDKVEPGKILSVIGPRDIHPEIDAALRAGTRRQGDTVEPAEFRMKDDDGNVYYQGRIMGDYSGFEPMDDYGTPNAGCTSIEYKKQDGSWEML